MARKCKVGLDYFSHDVDMMQDKKVKLLKAKHGLVGYATYIRLLEELYRESGYYLHIDEDFNILFSDDNNLKYDAYILTLNDCINSGLFDGGMYKKHSILTSRRIQENYVAGTERRKSVDFIKDYLLVDPVPSYNLDKVDVNINRLNVCINAENTNNGTQRKGKERRREEKREEIFTYWNDKAEHKHRGITNNIGKAIDSLSNAKIEEVMLAIDRYCMAYNDSKYYYSHTWTLDKFIKQGNGYKEWLDDGGMWVDYSAKRKPKTSSDDAQAKISEIINTSGDWYVDEDDGVDYG